MAPAHELFVRNDYTIIMINATDIQISDSHTTSQPLNNYQEEQILNTLTNSKGAT